MKHVVAIKNYFSVVLFCESIDVISFYTNLYLNFF